LYGFGYNEGTIGDGTTNYQRINPVRIKTPTDVYVTNMGAGWYHAVATTIHKITGQRELYAWGDNSIFQARPPLLSK